MIGYRLGMQ